VIVFGRRKPPGPRPKLDAGERLLAWAPLADDPDQAVVVTTAGLRLPGQPRLGWHQIHKATWSGTRLTVIPAVAAGEPVPMDGAASYTVMVDGEPQSVALAAPGDVPAEVRTRVTRSVAFTAHHPLPLGGVRVVGRRVPGVNGLAWHVRYDEGTPADDPDVTAVTGDLVRQAASSAADE
jgi:hypothetical protein